MEPLGARSGRCVALLRLGPAGRPRADDPDGYGSAVRTPRRERCDISERSASEDRIDATLANDPIESTEQAEPIDPTDSTDPTDPIDRIDPREPMLRIESCERNDHSEPREVMETSCDRVQRADRRTGD
jgi:hypothetical protein